MGTNYGDCSTITTNSTGDYQIWTYPQTYSGYPIYNSPNVEIDKENKNMRSLFKVYVVDPKGKGKLIKEETVIAKDATQAQMKVCKGTDVSVEIEDYDIIVVCLGQIREDEKVQEVKIVDK
jgi:hypothetical protein